MRLHPLLIGFAAIVIFFLLAPLVIIVGASFSDTTFLTFPPRGLTLHWFANIFAVDAFRSTMITSFELASSARRCRCWSACPPPMPSTATASELPNWLSTCSCCRFWCRKSCSASR